MKKLFDLLLKYKYLLFVLVFAITAGFSLLHSGLPPTHDGEYHVVRFWQFDKVLRDGDLYPRWSPDLNYGVGVPLFNYVYPLPNYVSSVFHLFNISFIDSFKLSLFLAIIFAALFSFNWLKIFFGNLGAMVGSVFYLFSPYLFVDVYIRGSVGEVFALSFFPAFLWVITRLILNGDKKFLPIAIIFLSLIIFSHNILAFMFTPFAIVYSILLILTSKEKRENFINFLTVFVVSLGLSAIFWLPAILETKYTVGLQIYDFKRNFPDLFQLIVPSWGSGFFGSFYNEMSVQIGIANLLAVLLSFFALFKFIKKKDSKKIILSFFIISFFVVLFLMQEISINIWNVVPLMNYFQFPWRFLSLIILICSFLAAASTTIFKNKYFSIFLIFFAVLLTFNYAHPAYFLERDDIYYQTRPNFIDGTNSIGNVFNTIWIKGKFNRKSEKIITSEMRAKINIQEIKSTKYIFNTKSEKDFVAIVNSAYFPGWIATIDGKKTDLFITNDGLIKLNVPKGEHAIHVIFKDTLIRSLALLLSLASLILVIILMLKNWYIKYK